MTRLKLLIGGFLTTIASLVVVSTPVLAAVTTYTVTPGNQQGWVFNPDPTNSTPYNFTTDKASIGQGSLYVQPISSTPAKKFIAAKTLGVPVSSLSSIAYDFLIAGNGTSSSANQFYLNVYTNKPSSTTYYDCRFDYVPSTGSTSNFTTASFSSTTTPAHVSGAGCPTTLAGMPAGSTAKSIALNVGDTSASDAGLAGYLDKAVITTTGDTKTYDFEPTLTPDKVSDCKHNGWKKFNTPAFPNQGQCIKYVHQHHPEVEGMLTMSDPSQKIIFSHSERDDGDDDHKANPQTVEYWNYDYPSGTLHYTANVLCVGGDTATKEARVLFQIPDGFPGLSGLYVVSYVKEVDHGTDLYGHAATADLATATQWCQTGVGFSPTMYPVTSGEIEVD